MIVTYDSRIGRPQIRGTHHGTPRIWLIQVRGDGMPDSITFRPSGKVRLLELAPLIEKYLTEYGEENDCDFERLRWTATAR